MATENLNIQVTANGAQAVSSLNRVDNSVLKTVKSVATLAGGIYALKKSYDTISSAIKAQSEQEDIFNRLKFAVESTGQSFTAVESDLMSYFDSLQLLTRYGDSDTAKVMTDLIFYTNDFSKSIKNTQLVLDIAASKLFDVGTASRYVGMALTGNIEILGRYIPELKASNNEILKTMTAAEKSAYAIDLLNEKFGGLASADVETFSGKMQQISNYLGDIQEKIGEIAIENITGGTDEALVKVIELRDELDNSNSFIRNLIDGTVDFFQTVGKLFGMAFKSVVTEVIYVTASVKSLYDSVKAVFTGINSIIDTSAKNISAVFVGAFNQLKNNFEVIGNAFELLITGKFKQAADEVKNLQFTEGIKNQLNDAASRTELFGEIVAGTAEDIKNSFTKNFDIAGKASDELWGKVSSDSTKAKEVAVKNIEEIENKLAGLKSPDLSDIKINVEPTITTPDVGDINLDLSPIELEIKAVNNFEKELSRLEQYKNVGMNVTQQLNDLWTDFFNNLDKMGLQNTEKYAYYQALKAESDKMLLEEQKALIEEQNALSLSYYDTVANAAQTLTDQLIQGELDWAAIRNQVLSQALSATLGYLTDELKTFIITETAKSATKKAAAISDKATGLAIQKAAAVESAATAAVTGKAIALAYAPAAALASIATLGSAAASGAAGLSSTVALSYGLAAAKDGAYIDDSGKIHGSGTGTSDSIIAMTDSGTPLLVSNGEMVINADATAKNYDLLQKINKGYAKGGIIDDYDMMSESPSRSEMFYNEKVEAKEFKNVININDVREMAGKTGDQVLDIALANFPTARLQRLLTDWDDRAEISKIADKTIREKRNYWNMGGVEKRLDRTINELSAIRRGMQPARSATPSRTSSGYQRSIVDQDRVRNIMVGNGYDGYVGA